MTDRLILAEGTLVNIVAQDKELGDAENFAISRADEETRDLIGAHGNTYTVERAAEFMPDPSLIIGERKVFTIISQADGRYLGDIRLVHLEDDIWEFGIVILSDERCQGFGTDAILTICKYAFDQLGAEKVYLRVYQNNPRARKLYDRIGFTFERTEDDDYEIGGERILEDWMYITKVS